MNILICSVGRRVKLVEYFKKELNEIGGKLIAVDCDITAPALYAADQFEIVPKIDSPNYIFHLIQLCKKYNVKAILSLIDPELSLLAAHKKEFSALGVEVIVSDLEVVEICFDKYLTHLFLSSNFIPSVKTYNTLEKAIVDLEKGLLNFPLIVKPRKGSASIGISKISTFKELDNFKSKEGDFVIQPFIEGKEYGVDCYVDIISHETISIFMKEKIRMRAGETDKSISVNDPMLSNIIERLMEILRPVGPIDVDCFKTDEGYVVSEINPRFGGGYPHAHETGYNFIKYIIKNISRENNLKEKRENLPITTMIKFDQVLLLPSNELTKV